MLQPIRRIVTGHNDKGASIIVFNDCAPNANELKGWTNAGVTELWVTDEMPVDNSGAADRSLRPLRHDPTAAGTIFRVVEIPPEGAAAPDTKAVFDHLKSDTRPTAEQTRRHATMHKTNSIDYLVVISGTLTMIMDEGEVEMPAGTCIVQRGTSHGWANRGTVPVLLAAILVNARPVP